MVNFSELARRAEWVRPCCPLLLLLVAAGCSDPSAPRIGAIQSKAEITGAGTLAVRVVRNVDFDPNGFSLSVDGAAPKFVPAVFPGFDQAIMVSGLATGAHKLIISGVAGNCVASPQSPIVFAVSAGTTAHVRVAVVCSTHEATSSG